MSNFLFFFSYLTAGKSTPSTNFRFSVRFGSPSSGVNSSSNTSTNPSNASGISPTESSFLGLLIAGLSFALLLLGITTVEVTLSSAVEVVGVTGADDVLVAELVEEAVAGLVCLEGVEGVSVTLFNVLAVVAGVALAVEFVEDFAEVGVEIVVDDFVGVDAVAAGFVEVDVLGVVVDADFM